MKRILQSIDGNKIEINSKIIDDLYSIFEKYNQNPKIKLNIVDGIQYNDDVISYSVDNIQELRKDIEDKFKFTDLTQDLNYEGEVILSIPSCTYYLFSFRISCLYITKDLKNLVIETQAGRIYSVRNINEAKYENN